MMKHKHLAGMELLEAYILSIEDQLCTEEELNEAIWIAQQMIMR